MKTKPVTAAPGRITRRGFLIAGVASTAAFTVLAASADGARAEASAGESPAQEAEGIGRPPVALDTSLALPPALPSLGTSFLR